MRNRRWYRCGFITLALANLLCLVQPCRALVISELMYHPVEDGGTPASEESLEFIELYNDRAVFEDLGGWAFTNGITYHFPEGTILAGKEYLVVARNPTALRLRYPSLPAEKVFGPFEMNDSGTEQTSLNNDGERIELSNANGGIVLSFRYNDTWPWPNSPDGTGHSLVRARLGGDPEKASTWAPSTLIGGSPGGADEAQTNPVEPTLITLVDLGHVGRFFKGTQEPSPDAQGQPTTNWTEVSFDDDPATTGWLEGPGGYGYTSDPDEQQWIRTELGDMPGGYISIYVRLSFTLTQEQIDSFSQLNVEVHRDDGYVLYLNGRRVAGENVAGNPPAFSQTASSGADYLADNVDLTAHINQLVAGRNVLAMQVHNSNISTSSDCIASLILRAVAEPGATGDDAQARVLINELLTNSAGADWIELYNPGPVSVNLSNVYLSDGRFELLDKYRFPAGVTLHPGQFITVGESELGFKFSSTGETVYLTAATGDTVPGPVRVLDAVRFQTVEENVTLGRFPSGANNFVALSAPTRGAANAPPRINDIVINEIMYQHGTRDDNYEYIELYNRGASTVSLGGWAFTDGVGFTFPPGTEMAPGSYLVIAKNPARLKSTYANLVMGSNLLGPYTGRLDDHSERIRLSYPNPEGLVDPDGEPYMITADEVTYCDGGRWPIWADGQGASLELRDPDSDNDSPDAWAESDESTKAVWEEFSFTIAGSDGRYTHDEVNVFDMLLLNRGEVLLDDLQLIIKNADRLSNGGFESGESGWRILGNHVQSFVTDADAHSGGHALHLIATGHGDPGANRINQSISPITGGTVTFRGWAKRLRGSRYLLLRVSNDLSPKQPPRPAHSFELDMPMNQGTPGLQNTAFTSNRGPDIAGARHEPVLPASGEPIVVTATVTDNDGVAAVTLYYRSEGAGGFDSAAMVDDGSGDDMIAGDGIFTGTIPGAGAGTMRAFYIQASDGAASTRFPTRLPDSADVPERTCLVRVGDTLINSQFASYRVWLSNDVVATFRSRANLSNELLDCTFVYNDKEVFYNTRMRFRGSPFIRGGSNWNPVDRHPFRIDFNSDQKFRNREEINLDRTEGSNRGPLQERASYWFYEKMGLQYSRQEYVRPIMNGVDHGNYEDVQKIDGEYIDMWWPNDTGGRIHKIDDYFEYDVLGTRHAHIDEGLKYDGGHPLLKETYRWGFEKRSHRQDDNWDDLFYFAQAMNTPRTSSTYESAIESVIHPEHFAAVLAIRHAVGDWDSYGYTRGKNNYFYYSMPEGKWYLLPWDIDFTLGSGHGATQDLFSLSAGEFPEVNNFFQHPKYRRMYLEAFARLVYGPWQTSYGTSDPPTAFDRFLDNAADVLNADGYGGGQRRDSIKQFVKSRRSFILSQIPVYAFEITTNNGDAFCTSASRVTIEGVRPLGVTMIEVNGTIVPVKFTGENIFEVEVDVAGGTNLLTLKGLGSTGDPVPGAEDSIVVTRVPAGEIISVTPNLVCNDGPVQLTIHGRGFQPGTPTAIALTNASAEMGFDALYVQNSEMFDRIDAATVLLDDPSGGVGDAVHAVHRSINLHQGGREGIFSPSDEFAAPFNSGDPSNFAVRFTGYIYVPSPGVRCFGVNSDDGFSLRIEGQLVGEWGPMRYPTTSDCTKNRTAGTMKYDFPAEGNYYMQLDYYENIFGEEIEFFQTDESAENPQLINGETNSAELIVFRDNATRIEATNVVVVDENTITFEVDFTGVAPDLWTIYVTPECGQSARSVKENVLRTTDPPQETLDWDVAPVEAVFSAGVEGGAFLPAQHSFVISNNSTESMDWSVSTDGNIDWLDLPEIPFGTIDPGQNAVVTVSLNSVVETLPQGAYTCPLVFSVGCNPGGDSELRRRVELVFTHESDFNRNLTVDMGDLGELAREWRKSCTEPDFCRGVDLDGDGNVGLGDLMLFAGQWLLTTP